MVTKVLQKKRTPYTYLSGVSGGLDQVSHLSKDLVLRLLLFLGVHSESEACVGCARLTSLNSLDKISKTFDPLSLITTPSLRRRYLVEPALFKRSLGFSLRFSFVWFLLHDAVAHHHSLLFALSKQAVERAKVDPTKTPTTKQTYAIQYFDSF